MTETPADNGADGMTQPLPQPLPDQQPAPAPVPAAAEAAPRANHTRTILEVVGAVVAVGAILVAGVGGFVLGHFSGRNANDRPDRQLSLTVDGQGHGQRDGGQQGQALPSMPGQQGDGQQGKGQQGPGGMMMGPEDLQRFLQGLGGMMGQQGNGQQGNGQQGPGGMTLGPEDLQQFLQGLGGMMDQGSGSVPTPATPVPSPQQ